MTEYEMPAYQLGLRTSCRLLPNGETVYGLAWEINRRLPDREGEWPNFETLMVSKDVFEFEDDAKRDAVRAGLRLGYLPSGWRSRSSNAARMDWKSAATIGQPRLGRLSID